MAFMWLWMSLPSESIAGPCLNIKMIYFQVWDFHYKDKTVVRPSYVLDGNLHVGKTSLYWDAPPPPPPPPWFLHEIRTPNAWISNYILWYSMGYDYMYLPWTQAQYIYMSFKRFWINSPSKWVWSLYQTSACLLKAGVWGHGINIAFCMSCWMQLIIHTQDSCFGLICLKYG